MIQHTIHRQLRQRNHLLNAQGQIARRPSEVVRQLTGHDIRRSQGFTGMGQQGFGIYVGRDDENRTWTLAGFGLLLGRWRQIVIECTDCGVVELFGIKAGVGETDSFSMFVSKSVSTSVSTSVSGGFGLSLIIVKLLTKSWSYQHHLQMMGGSCARVCKTELLGPRQTRRSPAHSHHKSMTIDLSATIIGALKGV